MVTPREEALRRPAGETLTRTSVLPPCRAQLPPAEVLPTPYRTVCWLGPAAISRTQRNTFSRLGLDQQAAAQVPLVLTASTWVITVKVGFIVNHLTCRHTEHREDVSHYPTGNR